MNSSVINSTNDSIIVDGVTYPRKDVFITISGMDVTVHELTEKCYSLLCERPLSYCGSGLTGTAGPCFATEQFNKCLKNDDIQLYNVKGLLSYQQCHDHRYPLMLAANDKWVVLFKLDPAGVYTRENILNYADFPDDSSLEKKSNLIELREKKFKIHLELAERRLFYKEILISDLRPLIDQIEEIEHEINHFLDSHPATMELRQRRRDYCERLAKYFQLSGDEFDMSVIHTLNDKIAHIDSQVEDVITRLFHR